MGQYKDNKHEGEKKILNQPLALNTKIANISIIEMVKTTNQITSKQNAYNNEKLT